MHCRTLTVALIGILLGAAPTGGALGQERGTRKVPPDPRVWSLVKGDDTFVLRYAIPRAAEPDFAITCQPAAQLLQIAFGVKSTQLSSGDGVPLSLSTGKRRLELAATAFASGAEKGDLVVEAAVALEPRPLDLFRTGDTLSVTLPGAIQTYPLAGLRTRLADFERACLGRR